MGIYLKQDVENWLDNIKRSIEHGKEGDTCTCETGDKFVVIGWDKEGNYIHTEGDFYPSYESPELAWSLFKCAFGKYMSDQCVSDEKAYKIYWRSKPSIEEHTSCCDTKRYRVWARCFIGDAKRGGY